MVVVVAILVTVLFRLLTGQPTYAMVEEQSSRSINGELEGMSIDPAVTGAQAFEIDEYVEDSPNNWRMLDRMGATLAVSQACRDARLNRQTAVNLTLVGLVIVVVPASVYGVLRLASRTADPSGGARSSATRPSPPP